MKTVACGKTVATGWIARDENRDQHKANLYCFFMTPERPRKLALYRMPRKGCPLAKGFKWIGWHRTAYRAAQFRQVFGSLLRLAPGEGPVRIEIMMEVHDE